MSLCLGCHGPFFLKNPKAFGSLWGKQFFDWIRLNTILEVHRKNNLVFWRGWSSKMVIFGAHDRMMLIKEEILLSSFPLDLGRISPNSPNFSGKQNGL